MPWTVFRAISDRATDGSVDDEVFHLSHQDGTPDPRAVARYLVRHPGRIPGLVRHGAAAPDSPPAGPPTPPSPPYAPPADRRRRPEAGRVRARRQHRGRRPGRPRGRSASAAGPSQMTEPCSSSTTRSHSARAWPTCCSTISSAVPSRPQAGQLDVDLVDDDRRQAERQLVGDQQLRAPRRAPGPATACAARRPTACRRAGAGGGRARGTGRRPGPRAAGTPLRPFERRNDSRRFSSTVSVANTDRPSGAWATPARAKRCGGAPVRSSPVDPHRARGRGDEPGGHPGDGGLAGAVGAEERHRLTGLHGERDVEERRGTGRSRPTRRRARARRTVTRAVGRVAPCRPR